MTAAGLRGLAFLKDTILNGTLFLLLPFGSSHKRRHRTRRQATAPTLTDSRHRHISGVNDSRPIGNACRVLAPVR